MTKRYLQMLQFVLVMGLVTSLVFVGMELWTAPLIAANSANELRSSILSSNDIAFNTGNINAVYTENVEEITVDGLMFYVVKSTGNISFEFEGGGVWGPIEGVITLAPDKETIVDIRVLEQQETPGLGGIVATRNYLSTFKGIRFLPTIEINKPDSDTNKANEVDSITGATRTSKAFEGILNETYTSRLDALAKVGN
ncbi:MAG: FMN-binding protein [Erysipelothrix sp.]|jgi:Na+-transporting NADH:ubiquinone oxidoreductase subunit C|nr:FMN-binding protein [Erysipelothrix sp.]